MVSSFCPYDVVNTCGGFGCSRRKLIISRNPFNAPSWILFPTEINTVGTLLANPTVYCISRSASIPGGVGGFSPPSKVSTLNVIVFGKSGLKRSRNIAKSTLLANCSMKPATPSVLDDWVARNVGMPYIVWRHAGVTRVAQVWAERFDTLDAGTEISGRWAKGLSNL